MNFAVLTLVAILQLVFVVLLLITLALGRMLSEWRTSVDDRHTERLTLASRDWLSGRRSAEDFAADIERARYSTVTAVLQRFGNQVAGQAWEDLVDAVRQTSWFDALKSRAHSRLWWRRLSATHGFAMVAVPEDAPTLESLIHDHNPVVRLGAVATIRRVLVETTLEAVLELADTQQRTVRRYVLEMLTLNQGLDLRLIQQRLDDADGTRQLRTLLNLVAGLGVPSFLDHVLPHAEHPDLEVRIAVARTLARFPHPRSAASLCSLVADPHWQVRAQAASALGVIGAREAVPTLGVAIRDPSWWVRMRAALALRRLGSHGTSVLEELTPEDDRYAYEMARYVLGLDHAAVAEYGGPSAVDYSDAIRRPRAA
ncbi:MAG: HEAT repeat domain-containing protein [Gemmatimonadota bacterium]|nr:HEAT repeat domain-containing protein [Gemmatimonadota bacterium]